MSHDDNVASQPPEMSLLLAAGLQDHLMTASNDLERLQRLLDDACLALMEGFHDSAGQLGTVIDQGHEITPHLTEVRQTLFKAVTLGSSTSTECTGARNVRMLDRVAGSRCRSMVNLTTEASTLVPSWKRTSFRSLNV